MKKIAFTSFAESELEELKAGAERSYKERYLYLKRLQKVFKPNKESIDVDDIGKSFIVLKRKDAD